MGSKFRGHNPILRPSGKKTGRGLFGHIRDDTTTVFQDFVGIVLGSAFLVLAIEIVLLQLRVMKRESVMFGHAENPVGSFLLAAGFVAIAVFFGHVGVIYWFRRLFHAGHRLHAKRVLPDRTNGNH